MFPIFPNLRETHFSNSVSIFFTVFQRDSMASWGTVSMTHPTQGAAELAAAKLAWGRLPFDGYAGSQTLDDVGRAY